ncbi:hypothetical protein [[Eubacterium] cellulosolvens]
MPRKIVEEADISIPEAKMILEKAQEPNEFQRRTLDYLIKFTRVDPSKVEKLVKILTKKHKLEKKEIIQIINCMPKSSEELRAILAVKGKVILSNELDAILKDIEKYRIVKE